MAIVTSKGDETVARSHQEDVLSAKEKGVTSSNQELDVLKSEGKNLVYDDVDQEPELGARTYIALGAFFLLNYVQVYALQGPPLVLSWIGSDLDGTAMQNWVPTSLSLVQAVLSPLVASASDTFQARKAITVGSCLLSLIGSAIAPGSKDIYRLIAAQCLIGIGFAAVPLAYAVPSEILPRRWRPLAQAMANVAAALACSQGPLTIGALTRDNPHQGWRTFFWIQMGMWGVTALGILVGYRPPKRHTRYDHLSVWQKLACLDLPGLGLLTLGLTLFLVGVNLGGGLYPSTNSRVLSTLVTGIVTLIAFCLYEWKGTNTGFLHHDLFRGGKNAGRTFALCTVLIAVECAQLFAYIIFYPVLTTVLFEQDPFLLAARAQPFWIAACLSTIVWGWISSRFRTIREPLFVGFVIYTAGYIGWSTIQPGDDLSTLIFGGLAGIGFGAPLILIVTAAQLATPHKLIATSTSVITTSRAVSSAVFIAIFAAVLNSRLTTNLPRDIGQAALGSGLPATSLPAFIGAIASGNTDSLSGIPGVTPEIITAGVEGLKQAFADSLRVIFIISVALGVVGTVMCVFLGNFREQMNYLVEAPIEELHAKQHWQDRRGEA